MVKTTQKKSSKPKSSDAAVTAKAVRKPRILHGVIVSNKMQKTAVLKVDRQILHPTYLKYMVRSKKFKIHDPNDELQIGDWVTAEESRPLSRHKRFVLKEVLKKNVNAQLNSVEVDVMADVAKEALSDRAMVTGEGKAEE